MLRPYLTLILGLACKCLLSQPGTPDIGFNSTDIGYTAAAANLGSIRDIELSPDGLIYVASDNELDFLSPLNRIYRLLPDGRIDETFNTGGGFVGNVMCMKLLENGKLLVGGGFTEINGQVCMGMALFNPDGSIDNSFTTASGFNAWPLIIEEQTDGKILVGGNFTTYRGLTANRLIRLLPDGTKDNSFNIGSGMDGNVTELAIQSDGKIFVGGFWNSFNGNNSRKNLVRLNQGGSLDNSFTLPGIISPVQDFHLYPDGRILVSSQLAAYNGQTATNLLRFMPNGQIDSSFYLLDGPINFSTSICVDNQGNIYIGGEQYEYQQESYTRLIKLDESGHEDTNFQLGPGFSSNQDFFDIVLSQDGNYIILDCNGTYNGEPIGYIMKIHSNGSIDETFAKNYGFSDKVRCIVENGDNNIWIGGDFSELSETNSSGIVKVDALGVVDPNFVMPNKRTVPRRMKIDSEGRMICAGSLEDSEISWRRLFRILPSGEIDNSFNTGSDFSTWVYDVLPFGDQYIAVGGFVTYNGITRNRIAKLNENGSLVANFASSVGFNNDVRRILLMPDSTFLVLGHFTSYNGFGVKGLAKLSPDGELLSEFNPGTGFVGSVEDIALQADGKIIVVGSFDSYQGTSSHGIVRVLPNGTRDNTFNVGSGFDDLVLCVTIQDDGKILCGGRFTSYKGASFNSLIRLLPNGDPDPLFNLGNGVMTGVSEVGDVHTIEVLHDQRILIGGDFYFYNGIRRNHAIMMLGGDSTVGCQQPDACNYNPNVSVADNSCVFPGCTDAIACNFNPQAGCDDNSCDYLSCIDSDNDGLSNLEEMNIGTSPFITDTDNDGLSDFEEWSIILTSPIQNDTDGDGLSDSFEISYTVLSPVLFDTDSDGCPDGLEAINLCDDNSPPCPTDINKDGYINTTDLLLLITGFGTSCP